MDPSSADLRTIAGAGSPLQALLDFVGISPELKSALWEAMGGIDKVRELIFIPIVDWNAAVQDMMILTSEAVAAQEAVEAKEATDEAEAVEARAATPAVDAKVRKPNPKEKAQVGMLRRYARLLCDLPGDEGSMGLSSRPAAAAPIAPQVPKRKFKISNVVDQGDDQEIDALPAADFRVAVKRFRASNDGLDPAADEEATPDQLQGVAIKLAQDAAPYADFAVLRPFGQRLERSLKFRIECWDPVKAKLVSKELPGPPSIDEWRRSWKVFTFIMVALGAVSRARLDRYRDKIGYLNDKFGQMRGCTWWLIALADQRMRSERMEKLRRIFEAEVAEGRPSTAAGGFDATRPWDAVFLAAAYDSEFWDEEVKEAALLYIARVKDREEIVDPGHHVHVDAEWRAGTSRQEVHEEERTSGKSKARRDREKKKVQGVKEQQQWEKRQPTKGEDFGQ